MEDQIIRSPVDNQPALGEEDLSAHAPCVSFQRPKLVVANMEGGPQLTQDAFEFDQPFVPDAAPEHVAVWSFVESAFDRNGLGRSFVIEPPEPPLR